MNYIRVHIIATPSGPSVCGGDAALYRITLQGRIQKGFGILGGGCQEIWGMEVPIGYSGKSRWKVWGEVCIEVDDICKLYCSDVIWKKAKQYYS